jgi:chaperonin cofactor prefoldin
MTSIYESILNRILLTWMCHKTLPVTQKMKETRNIIGLASFTSILIVSLSCFSDEQSPPLQGNPEILKQTEKYQITADPSAVAISLLNQEKFIEAEIQLRDLLKLDPKNTAVLQNLALAEFKNNKPYQSLGHLLLARSLDPYSHQVQRQLDFLRTKIKISPLNRSTNNETSLIHILRDVFLNPIPASLLWGVSLLFVGITGWRTLSWLRMRRQIEIETGENPNLPASLIAAGLVGCGLLIVAALKLLDKHQSRGILIGDTNPTRSAPQAQSPVLLQLPGGHEVVVHNLIHQDNGDWAQIEIPGVIRGWVSAQNVQPTTED